MNATQGQVQHGESRKGAEEIFLWLYIAAETLCCIIGIFGNGLVIYLANRSSPQKAAFRYLNKVVRNLAVTDFLYCVLAIPLTAIFWIWSKILS